ncbi:MAG: methyltransferase domain-containing protein [Eubacteriales bacterium]
MTETDFLICPICGSQLKKSGHSYVCYAQNGAKRHCFDISSAGYSDLSYRNGGSGDPKDAVRDRTLFLDRGYYEPLSDEIIRICRRYLSDGALIIDAGCGEGYYSERIAAAFPKAYVFGVDLSKHAVHRASVRRNIRNGSNSFYAVSSVFALPVPDNCADFALSMFAPVAEDEIKRVLKNKGLLIIGAAGRTHLYELKSAMYDHVRLNDARADLPENMSLVDKTNVSYRIHIDSHEDIMRLFGMTPYKFRTSAESLNKLGELNVLNVEVNVDFFVYQSL